MLTSIEASIDFQLERTKFILTLNLDLNLVD